MRSLLLLILIGSAFSLFAQQECQNAQAAFMGINEVSGYNSPVISLPDCPLIFSADSVVWLAFEATVDTSIRITTDGFPGSNDEDTRLNVLTGSCDQLSCIAFDDDGGLGFSALVEIPVEAGNTYYLIFDNTYNSGAFSVLIEYFFDPLFQACTNAQSIPIGVTEIGGYGDSIAVAPNCIDSGSADSIVWLTYYSPIDTLIKISTGGFTGSNDENTRLSILKGNCSQLSCVAFDDDSGPGLSAEIELVVYAGDILHFIFDNSHSSDPFFFSVEYIPNAPLLGACENAQEAFIGITDVNGYPDTISLVDPCDFNPFLEGEAYAWLVYQPTVDTFVQISTTDSLGDQNTRLRIFTGDCDQLSCLASNDDGGTGFSPLIEIPVNAGASYYLVFDNFWINSSFDNDTFAVSIEYIPEIVPSPVSFIAEDFDTPFSQFGRGRCVVDMNNDHLDDVVFIAEDALNIFFQNPDGSLAPVQTFPTPQNSCTNRRPIVADINADGINDFFYSCTSNGITAVLSNDDGSYSQTIYDIPGVSFGQGNCLDLNGDGLLDYFSVTNVGAIGLIQQEDGTLILNETVLGPNVGGSNGGPIWSDFDNDGDHDLYISRATLSEDIVNRLFSTDGEGNYTEISASLNTIPFDQINALRDPAIGDLDNDGDIDIITGAAFGFGQILRNDIGMFTDATADYSFNIRNSSSSGRSLFDMDNDGNLDIIEKDNIYFNNGDLEFRGEETPFFHELAIGDLNNDGFLDILRPGNNGKIHYGQPNGNNYLVVNLEGNPNNPRGIGSRVELHDGASIQIRDIRTGIETLTVSTYNAHFGLGTTESIPDSVVVKWPSGLRSVVVSPEINAATLVMEPEAEPNSLIEQTSPQLINLYPNPVEDLVNLPKELSITNALIEISNINGKVLLQQSLQGGRSINVMQLPSGMYQLLYRSENTIRIGKFIKK